MNIFKPKSNKEIWVKLDGLSPEHILFMSSKIGFIDGVKSALKNYSYLQKELDSALCKISWNGNKEIIKILVDAGANINCKNGFMIRINSEKGKLNIVNFLIDNGADITKIRLEQLYDYETIKFFIDKGADVHILNDAPLRFNSEEGLTDIVKLLLDYGADVHANNEESIQSAVSGGYTETVKVLLDAGAKPGIKDKAIENAVKHGYIEILKMLLDAGFPIPPNYKINTKSIRIESLLKNAREKRKNVNEGINDILKPKSKEEIIEIKKSYVDDLLIDTKKSLDEYGYGLQEFTVNEKYDKVIIIVTPDAADFDPESEIFNEHNIDGCFIIEFKIVIDLYGDGVMVDIDSWISVTHTDIDNWSYEQYNVNHHNLEIGGYIEEIGDKLFGDRYSTREFVSNAEEYVESNVNESILTPKSDQEIDRDLEKVYGELSSKLWARDYFDDYLLAYIYVKKISGFIKKQIQYGDDIDEVFNKITCSFVNENINNFLKPKTKADINKFILN